MAVAVQHRRKITMVISDNQAMRSIRGLESRTVAEPFANVFRFRDPITYELGDEIGFDHGQVGSGLGAHVFKASNRNDLVEALRSARDHDGTCLIVVTSDVARAPGVTTPWWDIAPATVSDDGELDEARAAHERAGENQRFYY